MSAILEPRGLITVSENLIFPNRIEVGVGQARLGGMGSIFESEGFASCSALIIRKDDLFGFVHLLSAFRSRNFFDFFGALRGGDSLLIEGSRSLPKEWVTDLLADRYGIELIRPPVKIDTVKPGVGNMHFCVSYDSLSDMALVERLARGDFVKVPGFNGAKSSFVGSRLIA